MVRGSNHVVPLDRPPPTVRVSTEASRSWRTKSAEAPCDRSRENSREHAREAARDRLTGSQRLSEDTQLDGRGGRSSSAVQNGPAPSRSTAVGISGNAVAAATPGASKRREMGNGARRTLPPLHIINRHTVRIGRGGNDSLPPNRGAGARSPSPSPSSTARSRPGSTRRNELSTMGKIRAGVFTVEAAQAFADLQLKRGRARAGGGSGGGGGGGGGSFGGGGVGGAGPALGSAQEGTLVIQRKNARERNPGPTLEGVGERGAASSVLRSLKTQKCSRSVSIVLLHLMATHRIRLKLAYDHVRTYRMVAQPNEGFRFQLATTEVKMFGSSSVSRDAESIWNFYRWNEVKQGVQYHAIHPPQPCGGCTVA
eukprot:g7634.t1